MTLADIDRIHAIEQASHVEPWSRQILYDCVAVNYTCLVLEDQLQIQGYIICQMAVEECHLFNICVDKQSQRHGFGTILLNHLIILAREQGAKDIILEVRKSNQAALTMYKKYGFQQVGVRKEYYPSATGREDAIIHRLEL